MGAGASASIAAAVSPATVQTLREGLKDISAADRAKLAEALYCDENIYKDVIPGDIVPGVPQKHLQKHKELAPAEELAPSWYLQDEWALIKPQKQERESLENTSMSVLSCGGVLSSDFPESLLAEKNVEVLGLRFEQQQQQQKPHQMKHSFSPVLESSTPSTLPEVSTNEFAEVESSNGSVGVSDAGPCKVSLRAIEASVADVAKGPEEKMISGTTNADYQHFVDHDDLDVSDVITKAIDNMSTDMFNFPFSVSVALPGITDTPLIGISDGFCKLSGYSREEIVGQNCRFLLKGVPPDEIKSDTRQEARRYCKAAHLQNLTGMAHSLLLQRNARKNGELFWNMFMLTLLPGPSKRNYIVGLQLDLGPTIPKGEYADKMSNFWFQDHRENLLQVQRAMYGALPGKALPPANGESEDDINGFMGLAEDIQAWLGHAEEKERIFHKVGTLPWVAWPTGRNYALMNGGVSLLRLEADRLKKGAIAMSIFPVLKKPGERSFKIRVDDVCPVWGCEVHKGAVLPTMGFTLVPPGEIDKVGGLPANVEYIPQSVILHGDGRALGTVPDYEGVARVDRRFADNQALPKYAYTIKPNDIVECIWGDGYLKMAVEGKEIFSVQDPCIFAPSHEPAFAIVELVGAVSRATLIE